MFKLLENMKLYELNRVMRNSVEIHNLVKLTMDVLKKEIIFIHKEHKKVKSKPKIYKRLHRLYGSFKSAVFKKKKKKLRRIYQTHVLIFMQNYRQDK